MNRYAMSQGHLCRTNRTISLTKEKSLPTYMKTDVLYFTKFPNPYWGGYSIGFEAYSNNTLNKAKLLKLFHQLKRECQELDTFEAKVELNSEYFLDK